MHIQYVHIVVMKTLIGAPKKRIKLRFNKGSTCVELLSNKQSRQNKLVIALKKRIPRRADEFIFFILSLRLANTPFL